MPTWWDEPSGSILTGWAGGPQADFLSLLSSKELETLGLDILCRIFSHRRTTLSKQLVKVRTHRWDRDPDIRGAYSYIPVNGLDLPGLLAAPCADTLFLR